VSAASRALVREVGTTGWAVLLDVSLDARPENGDRVARTNVRVIADHLGLSPGTVARALARLCTAGLVHRRDRRDIVTGRFAESVYIVASTMGIVPCIDCPHTVETDTGTAHLPSTRAMDHPAGQGLPEGMANVCRPFIAGDQADRASEARVKESRVGRGDRQDRDGQDLASFRGSRSC
jgi:predicted DNA-binding transcriptional regulator YafY